MDSREAHARLGIPYGATKDEVKLAFRKLAKQYHPDVLPLDATPSQRAEAEACFKTITDAYSRLAGGSTSQAHTSYASRNSHHGGWQQATHGMHKNARGIDPRFFVFLFGAPFAATTLWVTLGHQKRLDISGRAQGIMEPPVNPFLEQQETVVRQGTIKRFVNRISTYMAPMQTHAKNAPSSSSTTT
ncbi:hypothetical protein CYMTET_7950 [Cymbomonas tetramitiformis]|uniref:J domain-containing protein n=1 Tax=Cymbomonas tetramitiformis TaxID=36881 RepID=A0AAE0LGK5_9CHLO|nr:hypothetical protein CYMTET_7950 [Cymbomonas tetramitiformis]